MCFKRADSQIAYGRDADEGYLYNFDTKKWQSMTLTSLIAIVKLI